MDASWLLVHGWRRFCSQGMFWLLQLLMIATPLLLDAMLSARLLLFAPTVAHLLLRKERRLLDANLEQVTDAEPSHT
jgi:hypothetical protein